MEGKWLLINIIAVLVIVAISFFIGYLAHSLKKKKYDGTLLIETVLDEENGESRDRFQFIFATELEDLTKQTELIMKIEHSQNSQSI